jgi:dTDP-4-amino-4,6-dideoxygalactose transaminase
MQSFHETKNVTCGEGGALLVNDPVLVERALIVREKGTNRNQFVSGQVDKYTWVDLGSSYLPSDLLAAFLLAQLEGRQDIQGKRRRIWEYYQQHLESWANETGVRIPVVPSECEQSYHMFYLVLPSPQYRQELIAHLKMRGILSVFHYVPLHSSEMGQRNSARRVSCPVTDDLSARLLRLPFYSDLTDADLERVVSAVISFNKCGSVPLKKLA